MKNLSNGTRHALLAGATVAMVAVGAARIASAQGCPGDISTNGEVNGADLGILLSYWGPRTQDPFSRRSDISDDGMIDGADIALLLAHWGYCAPTVESVAPASGCYLGGTQITIDGQWLGSTTVVTVGGNECSGVVPISATRVVAITPPGYTGPAAIQVKTLAGTFSATPTFSYLPQEASTIAPSAGTVGGGTEVTIRGRGLMGVSGVRFAGTPAVSFVAVSETEVRAVTPPGLRGNCTVEVTCSKGAAAVAGGFTYVEIPTWATLVEAAPNPNVVTDPNLRTAIAVAGYPWRVRDQTTQIEMLLVPAGIFLMGCSQGWEGSPCHDFDLPDHQVTITQAYYLGRYEVPQYTWQSVMGTNPATIRFLSNPVETVSWSDVQAFLAATGMRLPTEAEWEYACRAGTTTPLYNGPNGSLDAIAWSIFNTGGSPRPCGSKQPNALGLHDMIGNVWEWVQDYYGAYRPEAQQDPTGPAKGTDRAIRGGSAVDGWTGYLRSSARRTQSPDVAESFTGFRVARDP